MDFFERDSLFRRVPKMPRGFLSNLLTSYGALLLRVVLMDCEAEDSAGETGVDSE